MIAFPFIFLFVKFANIFIVNQDWIAHNGWNTANIAITGNILIQLGPFFMDRMRIFMLLLLMLQKNCTASL